MDISDEELFDVTPVCSTSTSLNMTETRNLMQDLTQEKDSNNILTKDISVKLTRLPNTKEKKAHRFKSKRRNRWRNGLLKGRFTKKKKQVPSSKSSSSQQAFRNTKPVTEAILSEDRGNEQTDTYLHNPSYQGELYRDTQQNEQRISNVAQSTTENFILSTCEAQEEDLCVNVTQACARTLPYKFYRKNIIPSNVSAIDYCDSSSTRSSSSKDTNTSSHSDKSNLTDRLSQKDTKKMNKLIRLRLELMAKKMEEKLNKWKFKRKNVHKDIYSSDSEVEERPVQSKRRRILLPQDSDSENEPVNNMAISEDNNRSESHLSLETIDAKKTCIQFSSPAKVILTKLEEMEDEDVIKWRKSKTKSSDIAPESIEEQLDRRKLLQNLITSDSKNKLIVPTEDKLETQDIPKDSPLTNSCIEKRVAKSKLNKPWKKYKLFKKPKVLLMKLDNLHCSSKDGRYSATEVERLIIKKYLNFVINPVNKSKSHELKTYKHMRLQSRIDANTTCMEDHSISSILSREQSMDERQFIEDNSIKDVETTENTDENAPFQIHRKPIQKHCKTLLPRTSGKKNSTSSQERLELWRNAFRAKIMPEKSQKAIASTSKSSETLPIPQNSPKKSVNAECESVVTLASTSTSSMKHTLVGSPTKLTSSKKQTETSTKPTEYNDTSKPESSISSKILPSDANVDKTISRIYFTQSNDTVSKSPCKNAKKIDVITLDAFLNSNEKISEISPKLHMEATNLELSTNDKSVKSKTPPSKNCSVEQSSHKKEESHIHKCIACGMSFKNNNLLLKHLANSFYTKHINVNSKSTYASKCIKASLLKIMNKEQNLENSKPSTSKQQCSSVNGKNGSHQFDKFVNSVKSSKIIKRRELFKVPKNKMKTRSDMKSKSDQNSSSKVKNLESNNVECNSSTNIRVKQKITCKICSKSFNNKQQLFEDMGKHMANDFQNMQMMIENYITSTQVSKTKDQVSNDIVKNSVEAPVEEVEVARNEPEKSQPENTNESSAENLVSSEVSQQDATKERNKISNLSVAEYTIEQDVEEQSTPVMNNAEQEVSETQCAEKENVCDASSELRPERSLTICKCHRSKNKTNERMESNIHIEIVLLCTTCQTIFRSLECFEMHCTSSVDGTLCNKNRLQGRKSKLLCVSCQQTLNSLQDLLQHLKMHSRLNRTGTVTFSCSICKVIFYSLGPLFKSHFQNHEKNSLFLASRLSFPRPSYISTKLIKLPATDMPIELLYIQVADYVCQDCRMPFVYEQDLKSHKAICESVTNSVEPRIGSLDGRSTTSITSSRIPILLICGFCNKTFYSRMSFELHSLEHTQKRELHLHYTCVAVTAVTKVYICKVCTSMWQCLQTFKEHWQTHSELRAEYICSVCRNYFHSVELFQKHTLVHRNNNEKQQMPITCEVIYRDISDQNSNINSQKDITINELPYMNLNCFDSEKDFVGKTVNDKSQESTRLLFDALTKNRSTQLSVRSNKEAQATRNVPQVPIQVPSSNSLVAVTQSEPNSNGNSGNVDDDSDEELTIVLSESEESSVSSGIKKSVDSMPSTTPKNTKSTTSASAITDEQMRCSSDTVPIASSTKTSNYVKENTSLNSRISVITPIESENTQLKTNSSVSKDNNTLENCVDHSVSSIANSSREDLKESLPKNAMSSVPKSFLRVRDLAELTNTPSEKSLCQVCGMSFESLRKLRTHMLKHIHLPQNKKDSQITSSGNIQVWPAKPTVNPQAVMFTTSTQDPFSSAITPSVTVRPNTSTRVVAAKSQVAGVKPLRAVKCNTNVEGSKLKEVLSRETTSTLLNDVNATSQQISQKTAYHQNLPPLVNYPLNKSVQSLQQQQSTGTAAVRPILQTYPTSKPPPPYLQQQQPQHLQQPLQMQQQSQQLQQSQLMHQQKQQQIQQQLQQPQLQQTHQQQQQHIQQLQQMVHQQNQQQLQRQLQQSQLQQTQQQQQQQPQQQLQLQLQLKQQQFQQHHEQQHLQQQQLQQHQLQQQQLQQHQLQQQQLQQQQLQQQQLQQQQLQQQQQLNIGTNVMHYTISKSDMSYQLHPINIVPPSTENVMLVTVNTMQQVSENPERYTCLYCPGFECGSVQEFALHEHSPKHEARSHYNSVAYVSRT